MNNRISPFSENIYTRNSQEEEKVQNTPSMEEASEADTNPNMAYNVLESKQLLLLKLYSDQMSMVLDSVDQSALDSISHQIAHLTQEIRNLTNEMSAKDDSADIEGFYRALSSNENGYGENNFDNLEGYLESDTLYGEISQDLFDQIEALQKEYLALTKGNNEN